MPEQEEPDWAIVYIRNNCRRTELILWSDRVGDHLESAAADIEHDEETEPHPEGVWIWVGSCRTAEDADPQYGDFKGQFRRLHSVELIEFSVGRFSGPRI